MRDLILEGNGSSGNRDSEPTLAWISSRQSSCREATRRETQAMCTCVPVAMNSRLSLWPQVMADTVELVQGMWAWYKHVPVSV